LVDGGPIQLEFAQEALRELSLSIPIIALAERFEEVYIP
jgi:UvrC Helix-hairpin-helix N-terminal.